MSKLSAASVIAAIRQLTALDLAPKENSWLEVFLSARRLAAAGKQPTTATIGPAVKDLFVVLPNDPNGRIQAFRLDTDKSRLSWLDNKSDTGRKTVWNGGTTQTGKELCDGTPPHLRNGLRADAAEKLKALLAHAGGKDLRPPREALLVYLLRDRDFPASPISVTDLEARAAAEFGLSANDLDTITTAGSLGVPMDGTPEWTPQELPQPLRPTAIAAQQPTAGAAPSVVAVANPMVIDPRVRRMLEIAIASSPAVLLVGPPGTGKSSLLHEVASSICADPAKFGVASNPLPPPMWVTGEEGWTARELVGGESIVDGKVVFRPGHLLRSIRTKRWLIIDELNRADMDRIFGPVFTWLAGDSASAPVVSLGPRSQAPGEPEISLAWAEEEESTVEGEASLDGSGSDPITFRAGTSWRILGTYNAVDAQRVFRVGQALGRRFVRVPVPPITGADFASAIAARTSVPQDAQDAIVALYVAHLAASPTTLGPALFFRMAEYLRVADELADPPRDPATLDAEALAEAYLVNAGAWLARLEDVDLAELGNRVTKPGPLSEEQWKWISSMLPNLG